jgi:hypothetical protein
MSTLLDCWQARLREDSKGAERFGITFCSCMFTRLYSQSHTVLLVVLVLYAHFLSVHVNTPVIS